mgnify:CR=1 FL=1
MNKKFIATIFICLTAGVLLGWIIFDPESNQSQTLEERQEYIDFLKSNPDEKIQDLNDLISVVGWEEYMEIFKTARSFVGDHSADDMVFDLIFQWKKGNWIKFDVIPENIITDNAELYMEKIDGEWTGNVVGTSFEDLWEEHPEFPSKARPC